MKENSNIQSLFVAILLIIAGTASPSNGVDDRVNKTSFELITTMLIIIFAGLAVYFVWNWFEKPKKSIETNYKAKEKNTLTTN